MKNSPLLDRYKGLVSESLLAQIYEVAQSLAGLHVLHINTTAQGGGVAEILSDMIPLVEELGIQHDWKVISLDEASGSFTARLVDMLQGYDMGAFPEAEKQVFLEKLRHAVNQEPAYQADIYFIHDFQLVPLAEFFPWMRPAIWFCHVDTAHPNPCSTAVYRAISGSVCDYVFQLFSLRLQGFTSRASPSYNTWHRSLPRQKPRSAKGEGYANLEQLRY